MTRFIPASPTHMNSPLSLTIYLYNNYDITFLTHLKPVTDEQVFYDKFLCDKFYLLVYIRATLTTSALVIEKIVKVQILFFAWVNKEKLSK